MKLRELKYAISCDNGRLIRARESQVFNDREFNVKKNLAL